MTVLIHDLIPAAADRTAAAVALVDGKQVLSYAELAREIEQAAALFRELGLQRTERVAIYLEKRTEAVIAQFGAAAAGGVYVPINPLLKAAQVGHILQDSNVRILVTSAERLAGLRPTLAQCDDLKSVVVIGALPATDASDLAMATWESRQQARKQAHWRVIDGDMAAILYTSGSTGRPKGVVLSHRNIVAGAASVAQYLENTADDRILSVLPLSFDYGMSQLTTAFHVGACVVLMNYLLPRDVVRAVEREKITGLAAVPPLWVQLAQLEWPTGLDAHFRYFTNSGGHMPLPTLTALRAKVPLAKPYLMYGLTEAFRSTYLPPSEVDRHPDSIGRAIPNAEILVVRADGSPCAPNEEGELVHRGIHVALGYWNDSVKTAERYKPAPGQLAGLPLTELAVWSGDTVKMDAEGFLYFVGRRDEMIKTSGYRVSPTEVEEVIYATGLVTEVAAVGVDHPTLGQAIVIVIHTADNSADLAPQLLAECKKRLPAFMVPAQIIAQSSPLPRNPNGKIDRKKLSGEVADSCAENPL